MVHFAFAPEDAEKAAAMFRELRDASRAEAGVVSFDVGRSRETPTAFRLWEVYRDQAAFDFHKNTEHFARLVVNGVRSLASERAAELLLPI
ncbi:MAG TPA: putative quinol monooxygenase [Candidatus Cybelea sp.]